VSHPMETGDRIGADGLKVPRNIINRFVCTYNGQTVFSADWHVAVSANPYIAFHVRASRTGEILMSWTEDDGSVHVAGAHMEVS